MGRGKIEIKRIENSSNRQVTAILRERMASSRRLRKSQLFVMPRFLLLSFLALGKWSTTACSRPRETTLTKILDKYHSQTGKRLWDAKHETLSNEVDRVKKDNDAMQIELRHLNGEDITSLNHFDLAALEKALENGLSSIRERKASDRLCMQC